LSAPALRALLRTVASTFAPWSMLRSSVASDELSLTTMISSGGRVWRRSERVG
jgi:hypothetical protein